MIEGRLQELERQVAEISRARRRERIAAIVIVGLIAAVACRPSSVKTPATPSAATSIFRAASEDGLREALLTPDGLTLNVAGKARASFLVAKDGSSVDLLLRDANGKDRVALRASDGPAGVLVTHRGGGDAVALAADEKSGTNTRIELFGAENWIAVADSRASLTLAAPDGHALWHAP